jgi:hypothetical protein
VSPGAGWEPGAGARRPYPPPAAPLRCIAVDWSGARDPRDQRKKIWLGEAVDGALVRLEDGRDRDELGARLIADAERAPELVVGLDFAFSLPAWALAELGAEDAPALWARAEAEGDRWLDGCVPPFWGRHGVRRPGGREELRRTEREVRAVRGIVPKSPLQIAGAGHVGTASVRGMPVLRRLRAAGFHVWPFDPPAFPLVVEIYPRVLTGAVNKSGFAERCEYLRTNFPDIATERAVHAMQSDDAFDAAVSALVMSRCADELRALPAVHDPQRRVEGLIWEPLAAAV